jgi:hypothetical protein
VNSSEAHGRLVELGAILDREQLPRVDYVFVESGPPRTEYADMYRQAAPEHISIDGSKLLDTDACALALLPNLTGIAANNCNASSSFVQNIHLFPKLESLAISSTPIQDIDLIPLRDNDSLRTLHVAYTAIGNASLAQIGSITNLELLDLRSTQVDDSGLSHLFRLRNLFTVDLRGSSVTATGQQTLVNALKPWLPDVEVLI